LFFPRTNVFPQNGQVTYDQAMQGSIADCYYISSIAGTANTHPQQIKNMVLTK